MCAIARGRNCNFPISILIQHRELDAHRQISNKNAKKKSLHTQNKALCYKLHRYMHICIHQPQSCSCSCPICVSMCLYVIVEHSPLHHFKRLCLILCASRAQLFENLDHTLQNQKQNNNSKTLQIDLFDKLVHIFPMANI